MDNVMKMIKRSQMRAFTASSCTSEGLLVTNELGEADWVYVCLQLTGDGKAAKGGVAVGDVVLSIDGISTDGMNHLEAQNKIKTCSGNLSLTLQK